MKRKKSTFVARWTNDCTALMVRLNAQGLTDREIERKTGLRFSGRWVRQQRRLRQIDPAWRHWEKR